MTEVGGLFFRVMPEKIRHRLLPVAAPLATALRVNAYQKRGVSRCLRKIADVAFERKINVIFGSINSSSTHHCAYSQLQGDRIIVNRKFFATRLVMRDGPIVFARDFDRKVVRQKRNLLATCVKITITRTEKLYGETSSCPK